MLFTRIAWILGLAALGGLFWLATIGFPPATPLLVTGVVLVLLVGGGNALRGRSTSGRAGGPGRPPPGAA
jgi:hypothetical protein